MEHNKPMVLDALYGEVIKRGLAAAGKSLKENFASRLYQSSKFKTLGWWFADRPVPEEPSAQSTLRTELADQDAQPDRVDAGCDAPTRRYEAEGVRPIATGQPNGSAWSPPPALSRTVSALSFKLMESVSAN